LATTSVKVAEALPLVESLTVTDTINIPYWVGTPLISPCTESINPGARAPDVIDHIGTPEYDPTARVAEYGLSVVPLGKVVVVIEMSERMVRVNARVATVPSLSVTMNVVVHV
jgi:hypothetical protein